MENKETNEKKCMKAHCRCMQLTPCGNHHYSDCNPPAPRGESNWREQNAEIVHDQWSHWFKYQASRMNPNKEGVLEFNDEDFGKWMQQAITPYKKLSEKEKESDRNWADKYLNILSQVEKAAYERGKTSVNNPLFITDKDGTINITETLNNARLEGKRETCNEMLQMLETPVINDPFIIKNDSLMKQFIETYKKENNLYD